MRLIPFGAYLRLPSASRKKPMQSGSIRFAVNTAEFIEHQLTPFDGIL